MNRLQNAIVLCWIVLLLLLVAFNWHTVWQPMQVDFLFIVFELPLISWLILGSVIMAVLLRGLAKWDKRNLLARTQKEISTIKAKAFDGLSAEFEKILPTLETQLGQRIESLIGKTRAMEVSTTEDAPPTLSPETNATLAELQDSASADDGGDKKTSLVKKSKKKARKKTEAR